MLHRLSRRENSTHETWHFNHVEVLHWELHVWGPKDLKILWNTSHWYGVNISRAASEVNVDQYMYVSLVSSEVGIVKGLNRYGISGSAG